MGSRTALITGATSGIGREMALQLAGKGWNMLVSGRDRDKGAAVLEGLRHLHPGGNHGLWLGDLADMDQVRQLAEWAAQYPVNVLVNNVGGAFAADTPLHNGFSRTFLLNLLSPWFLTRLMLPRLVGQEDARIVCSATSLHYYSDSSPAALARAQYTDGPLEYGVVKLAELAWMQHLGNELAGSGIAVVAADPGIAETDNFGMNYRGFAGAALRAFWLTYPEFQTKAKAAKPAVLAATDPRHKGVQGRYLGPDGTRQSIGGGAADLAFGRRVDGLCLSFLPE